MPDDCDGGVVECREQAGGGRCILNNTHFAAPVITSLHSCPAPPRLYKRIAALLQIKNEKTLQQLPPVDVAYFAMFSAIRYSALRFSRAAVSTCTSPTAISRRMSQTAHNAAEGVRADMIRNIGVTAHIDAGKTTVAFTHCIAQQL